MSLIAAVVSIALGVHDGPDPIAAWDFHSRHVTAGVLKARAGRDAKITGELNEAETASGKCLLFDGVNDWLMVAEDTTEAEEFLPKQKFTVEAWVALNNPLEKGSIVGMTKHNRDAEQGWHLGFGAKNFQFALATKGSSNTSGKLTYLKGTTEFELGRFYHVIGTYDGKAMRLYVNGKLESTSTDQSGDILYPEKTPFTIGCFKDNNEEFPMNGRVANVAVYDLVATPLAVEHLYEHRAELTKEKPLIQENPTFDWVVKPYLQSPTTSEMTVMWETTRSASSKVLFGPSKDKLTEASGSFTKNFQSLVHKVTLTGLTPESHYVYRVESVDSEGRKLESELMTFRTAPTRDRSVRFTIVGDTQDNPAVNKRIAEHMWNERPDFFMIVGDLVGTGANKTHWTEHFFGSMRPLLDRVPLIPVIGNHEGDARLYYDYMSVPAPEYWYKFSYGPADFFVVDSNRPTGPDSEQYKWLEAELAASTAKWKFVAHHHPPYSSDEDDYGNLWEGQSMRGDLRMRAMTKLYEKYGVDVVWAGHIHSYERTWPLISGSSAESGPVYIVCGGGGGGLERHGPTRPEFSRRIRHGHHYCVVSLHGSTFEMSAFDIEGRLFDTLTIKK